MWVKKSGAGRWFGTSALGDEEGIGEGEKDLETLGEGGKLGRKMLTQGHTETIRLTSTLTLQSFRLSCGHFQEKTFYDPGARVTLPLCRELGKTLIRTRLPLPPL